MVFLELRRDSRVTTGNSGCLLCWPRQIQSFIRVAKESWALLSSEQKRYKEELFPNLLRHCRKTADYFAACPYIRYNEQNNEILSDCFTRYNKIVDRLIVKLQQNSCPANPFASAWSAFLSKVSRAAVNLYNFIDRTLEVFLCKLPIELFQLPFRRRTLVEYHRDTIDYVGNGYSLQPIQGLNLECA